MRRRYLLWAAALPALLLTALLMLAVVLALPQGRAALLAGVHDLSGGTVTLNGLGGASPAHPQLARLELADAAGPWLTLEDLRLDWQPWRLLAGELAIQSLTAQALRLDRLPAAAGGDSGSSGLPLPALRLETLRIDRLDIGPALAGSGFTLQIAGGLTQTADASELALQILDITAGGRYQLTARQSPAQINASLTLTEPAHGLLAGLAGIGGGGLTAEASLDGPPAAVQTRLHAELDGLRLGADGSLDLPGRRGELRAELNAPAMQLRPELGWQSLAMQLTLHGAFAQPDLQGWLQWHGLQAGGARLAMLRGDWQSQAGQLHAAGELAGLALPAQADLLQGQGLRFELALDTAAAVHPYQLSLRHPLLNADVRGSGQDADASLQLPDLGRLTAGFGADLRGSAGLELGYRQAGTDQLLTASAGLHISGGEPWAALLGPDARLTLDAARQADQLTLHTLQLHGRALNFTATGSRGATGMTVDWQTDCELPAYPGRINAQGRLAGPVANPGLTARLQGLPATRNQPLGAFTADLALDALTPPRGRLELEAGLLGRPLRSRLALSSPAAGSTRIDVEQADWQSARLRGRLGFAAGQALPAVDLQLTMASLADLSALAGQALTGSVNASLTTRNDKRPQAGLRLTATQAGQTGGTLLDRAELELNVDDPLGRPRLAGQLTATAGQAAASLELAGPADDLQLQLQAQSAKLHAARLHAQASLDAKRRQLTLTTLQLDSDLQPLQLLGPARLDFGNGLAIDALRLGWRQAELTLAGRLAPSLALNVDLPPAPVAVWQDLLPVAPTSGRLQAHAELHGNPAQPEGRIHIGGSDWDWPGLPATANLNADAALHAGNAAISVDLSGGDTASLHIAGNLPLHPAGDLALRGQAALDLKLFNPYLNAAGRGSGGELAASFELAGSAAAPEFTGRLTLQHGLWQDYAAGLAVRDVAAAVHLDQQRLQVDKLTAAAGKGTLNVQGGADLQNGGMLDLTLTARNAEPLASDHLSATLDADLRLVGAFDQPTLAGTLRVSRADVRIPDRMPANLATLRLAGTAPPAAAAAPNLGLDLQINAPEQVFLRGRGVDAELGGNLKLGGSLAAPQSSGHLQLRSGRYTLAGQTLNFSSGTIGFDGGSLTDPTLNLTASTSRNNVQSTLTITGSANAPKFALTSTPAAPQDEILANLLFAKSAASLSPLELLQIAGALASLSGIAPGTGDPLEAARKKLGLDRLSAGGATPGVEGGRYIAPGVYLGARQGITGGQPQATVQIDLTRQLKLEGSVGNASSSPAGTGNSATNSLGVLYQYDY